MVRLIRIGFFLLTVSFPSGLWAVTQPALSKEQQAVLVSAEKIFKRFQISYVYGGSQLGDIAQCEACNECLEKRQPKPTARLTECAVCSQCSLDCSHFTQLVFKNSGFFAPYLTSKFMADLPPAKLLRDYRLVDLGLELPKTRPGDLLVYPGHVVLLTQFHGEGRGDIIHATGGREVKGPGQGVQKERLVDLANFRGNLLRILRHKALVDGSTLQRSPRMRPVVKKHADPL